MADRIDRSIRITTEGRDLLTIQVGAERITIDLMHGASPEARAALERLGLDLTAILAAEWGND